MILLILLAVSAVIWSWLLRELFVNGLYRGGFFNYRILWGLIAWAGSGLFVLLLVEISNRIT